MSGGPIAPDRAQSGPARFVIKLCGVRTSADARLCAAAGADELGVVFAKKSRRCVSLDEARAIRAALPAALPLIGVFQDPSLDELEEAARAGVLSALQLHGALPPGLDAARLGLPLHRALQITGRDSLAQLAAAAPVLFARLLLDGPRGGSGEPFPWALLREARALHGGPFHLAGGLTPGNVAGAIRAGAPDGVDVSSGIEGPGGFKEPERVQAFVRAARAAAEQLAASAGGDIQSI